jgi:hypothetical protein
MSLTFNDDAIALIDGNLNSPSGDIRVGELTFSEQFMEVLGFRGVDAAVQYEVFDRIMRDRDLMRSQIALFGESYYRASVNNDREAMDEILRHAAARGLDISSVMRSASRRARDEGSDMFGRNISPELLDRYERTLEYAGRET